MRTNLHNSAMTVFCTRLGRSWYSRHSSQWQSTPLIYECLAKISGLLIKVLVRYIQNRIQCSLMCYPTKFDHKTCKLFCTWSNIGQFGNCIMLLNQLEKGRHNRCTVGIATYLLHKIKKAKRAAVICSALISILAQKNQCKIIHCSPVSSIFILYYY